MEEKDNLAVVSEKFGDFDAIWVNAASSEVEHLGDFLRTALRPIVFCTADSVGQWIKDHKELLAGRPLFMSPAEERPFSRVPGLLIDALAVGLVTEEFEPYVTGARVVVIEGENASLKLLFVEVNRNCPLRGELGFKYM